MATFDRISLIAFIMVTAYLSIPAEGFGVISNTRTRQSFQVDSSTRLNIFGDMMKNAFSNDDSLGKAENAGLKGVSTINGSKRNIASVRIVFNSVRRVFRETCFLLHTQVNEFSFFFGSVSRLFYPGSQNE